MTEAHGLSANSPPRCVRSTSVRLLLSSSVVLVGSVLRHCSVPCVLSSDRGWAPGTRRVPSHRFSFSDSCPFSLLSALYTCRRLVKSTIKTPFPGPFLLL